MAGAGKKIIIVICLGISLILGGCRKDDSSSPGGGAGLVKVSIYPASATVASGATYTCTVELNNVGEAFYAAFDLTYDPKVIEFLTAKEEGFLSRDGSDPTEMQVVLQNGESGKLMIGLTRLGPIGGVSGTGRLVALTFKAVGPGVTTLAFSDPKGIRDSTDQDVPMDAWDNATLRVE